MSFFWTRFCKVTPDLLRRHPRTHLLSTNHGMSEDDSRSNLHSAAKVSQSQTTQVFGPEDAYYMVTRIQEDIPHISFSSSSGKQKWTIGRRPRFSGLLSSWRATENPPTSTTTSTGSQNCRNLSRQQCSPSIENHRNLNCPRTQSKQV